MRKTNDGIQVLTALEKAELKLSEAIEMARYEAKHFETSKKNSDSAHEENMKKEKAKDLKTEGRYSYENIDEETRLEQKKENSEERNFDTAQNLNQDLKDLEPENKRQGIQSFFDVAFEELDFSNKSILNQSKDYEIQSFNEIDFNSAEGIETDEIMPFNFSLESFEEEKEEIEPYDINKDLLLGRNESNEGKENTAGFVAELLEKAQSGAEIGSIRELNTELNGNPKSMLIVEQAKKEANEILESAKAEALTILKQAEDDARSNIEEKTQAAEKAAAENGYREGFEKGQNQGYLESVEVTNQQMIEEAKVFKGELQQSLADFEDRKGQLLEDHLNDLTNLALTVAEKIVKISLKSSKDVISKIIVAAAEDCRKKEWAKVYISNEDKALTLNLEKGLIDVLKQISPNIKVVVMEDEPSGTCIIETPDQVIDASVNVQLDAIKQIVNDNEL